MRALLVPLFTVLSADQLTKAWARASLWDPPRTVVVVPGWLHLTPVENRGVAFGLLPGPGALLAFVAFLAAAFLAVRHRREILAASLVVRLMGGALAGAAVGNLIDRARLGAVTDFVQVPAIPLFRVFNIADATLTVGGIALATILLLGGRAAGRGRPRRGATSPGPPRRRGDRPDP